MEQEIWKVWKDTRYVKSKNKDYNNRKSAHGHLYEVSNQGRAKVDGKLFDFTYQGDGYYYLPCNDLLHRVIATLFIPNLENKPCIDHIDGTKHNNRVDNLKWSTYSENMYNPITISRKTGQKRTLEQRKNIAIGTSKAEKYRHWYNDGINEYFCYCYIAIANGYKIGRLYHKRKKS